MHKERPNDIKGKQEMAECCWGEGNEPRCIQSKAIMRTGSRVYIGALLHNRSLSVFCASCGVGRDYVTAYLQQSEEGNREQKKSGLTCAHRDSAAATNMARQHIKEYFLLWANTVIFNPMSISVCFISGSYFLSGSTSFVYSYLFYHIHTVSMDCVTFRCHLIGPVTFTYPPSLTEKSSEVAMLKTIQGQKN